MKACPKSYQCFPDDVAFSPHYGVPLVEIPAWKPAELEGQTLAGYHLERRIYEDSLGAVFRASRQRMQFAVRVFAPNVVLDETRLEAMRRAQAALKTATHPGVVRVVETDQDETTGLHYAVSEWIEGRSLRAVLDERGHLEPAEAIPLLRLVLDALAALHDVDVIHGYLSPDTVYIERASNGRRTVRLMDAGLWHLLDFDAPVDIAVDVPELFAHRADYMAPETIAGDELVPATDVYGAGILAFEMLAGRPPFHSATPSATFKRHQAEDPLPVALVRKGAQLPDGLQDLLTLSLGKAPDRRFETTRALRGALGSVLEPTADEDEGFLPDSVLPRPAPALDADRGQAAGGFERKATVRGFAPDVVQRAEHLLASEHKGTATSEPVQIHDTMLGVGVAHVAADSARTDLDLDETDDSATDVDPVAHAARDTVTSPAVGPRAAHDEEDLDAGELDEAELDEAELDEQAPRDTVADATPIVRHVADEDVDRDADVSEDEPSDDDLLADAPDTQGNAEDEVETSGVVVVLERPGDADSEPAFDAPIEAAHVLPEPTPAAEDDQDVDDDAQSRSGSQGKRRRKGKGKHKNRGKRRDSAASAEAAAPAPATERLAAADPRPTDRDAAPAAAVEPDAPSSQATGSSSKPESKPKPAAAAVADDHDDDDWFTSSGDELSHRAFEYETAQAARASHRRTMLVVTALVAVMVAGFVVWVTLPGASTEQAAAEDTAEDERLVAARKGFDEALTAGNITGPESAHTHLKVLNGTAPEAEAADAVRRFLDAGTRHGETLERELSAATRALRTDLGRLVGLRAQAVDHLDAIVATAAADTTTDAAPTAVPRRTLAMRLARAQLLATIDTASLGMAPRADARAQTALGWTRLARHWESVSDFAAGKQRDDLKARATLATGQAEALRNGTPPPPLPEPPTETGALTPTADTTAPAAAATTATDVAPAQTVADAAAPEAAALVPEATNEPPLEPTAETTTPVEPAAVETAPTETAAAAEPEETPEPTPSGPSANELVEQAQAALKSGDNGEGRKLLDQALELEPNHGKANAVLGDLAWDRQEFKTAARHFRKASKRSPRSAGLHIKLGNCYLRLGQNEDALASFEQAARHADDDTTRKTAEARIQAVRRKLGK